MNNEHVDRQAVLNRQVSSALFMFQSFLVIISLYHHIRAALQLWRMNWR